jgi:PAP2 superfamily protein
VLIPRRLLFLAVLSFALVARSFCSENSVLYWNNQVLDATRLSRNPPPPAAVFFAAYHVAIFDAVNGITRTHQGWLVNDAAPAGADLDAAVAGAAHTVLLAYWSQSTNPHNLEVAYQTALAKIPEGQPKTDGLAWGKHVADLVIAARANSGYNKPIPGKYSSQEPGKWRETPSGFRPPTVPFFAKVTPFVMTSCDQFRAPPPLAINTKEYADEIAYVAKVGARDGAERTEYETLSTPFWSDDLGTNTPPGHWNSIASEIASSRNLSVPETARLFALLNLAEADAGISCWDTKFFYSTWRPETALRELDQKLNPHAEPKPDFIPNMTSPSFPSYTSGHSTFSAAGARILALFFGSDDIEFTVKSDGLPGAVRTFNKFSDAQREVGMSRVMGGIHTMKDNIEGQNAGVKIADWVFTHALRPSAPQAANTAANALQTPTLPASRG